MTKTTMHDLNVRLPLHVQNQQRIIYAMKIDDLEKSANYYTAILVETISIMVGIAEQEPEAVREYRKEIFDTVFKDITIKNRSK